jgi:chaperonin GroES
MFDKLKPLYDKVFIKKIDNESKSAGGIIIPDTAKEKAQTGKVISVGQGRLIDGKLIPLIIKVGDTVFFGKYAGVDAGNDHLIIKEDEILGIIEN